MVEIEKTRSAHVTEDHTLESLLKPYLKEDPALLTKVKLLMISTVDGRYRDKLERLAESYSEYSLIKRRIEIEVAYLLALERTGIIMEKGADGKMKPRQFTTEEVNTLESLGKGITLDQAARIKDIEDVTKHDVKAMERGIGEFLNGTSLESITNYVHYGLTSEDINNISYRLNLREALQDVCIPKLNELVNILITKSRQYRDVPMLARTHGQPALPTTLGKVFAEMAVNLSYDVKELEEAVSKDGFLTGKLNGAVGDLNALAFTSPNVDWIKFSANFVRFFDLKPNLVTKQINPYRDIVKVLQIIDRINGSMLDIEQDTWRYISDKWFILTKGKGEIGSSTMPQKTNPIDLETGKGSLEIADAILSELNKSLMVTRLQRDVSDSTKMRDIGFALGRSLLAYTNVANAFKKIYPDVGKMSEALNEDWSILTEAVQTLLRLNDVKDPYSLVKDSLPASGKIQGKEEWVSWINSLQIEDRFKEKLRDLTPEKYIGLSKRLTDIGMAEVLGDTEIVDSAYDWKNNAFKAIRN